MRCHYILPILFLTTACLDSKNARIISKNTASGSAQISSSVDYQKLSETGLFINIETRTIGEGIRYFFPNHELWTDGAAKKRWMYLPPNTQIDSADMENWIFPVGTKIWKEFSFGGRRVETRLIEKINAEPMMSSWKFYSFIWNTESTDADIAPTSGKKDVAFTGLLPDGSAANPLEAGTSHDVPSIFQCARCHNKGGDPVLGFSAIQLTSDGLVTLEDERFGLRQLISENVLSVLPQQTPRIPIGDPVTQTALGYLHANCGHCHNPNASAGLSTGLYLNLASQAATILDEPALQTSLNILTTGFEVPGRTIGENSFRLKPADAEFSAIYFRNNIRGGFAQMPPLGTEVKSISGLENLRNWISQM